MTLGFLEHLAQWSPLHRDSHDLVQSISSGQSGILFIGVLDRPGGGGGGPGVVPGARGGPPPAGLLLF